MKLAIYSDLHLEFGNPFRPNIEADLMILAGDIILFESKGFEQLKEFLKDYTKPVLFVAGNHEYYTKRPMNYCDYEFREFLKENLLNVTFLQDQSFELNDVHFFGGTMWTDFNKGNQSCMMSAHRSMNDYYKIFTSPVRRLIPKETVEMHERYRSKLIKWLKENEGKKRVVISHHAPCPNPKSPYHKNDLHPAYVSEDMVEVIEEHQPELWCYGHCHLPDDQMIGKTRIVHNPSGYYDERFDTLQCEDFDPKGMLIEV